MARPKRFELLTPRFVVWCSIQLSYGRELPYGIKGHQSGSAAGAIAIAFAGQWQGGNGTGLKLILMRSTPLRGEFGR
jgi:hypothetical protein